MRSFSKYFTSDVMIRYVIGRKLTNFYCNVLITAIGIPVSALEHFSVVTFHKAQISTNSAQHHDLYRPICMHHENYISRVWLTFSCHANTSLKCNGNWNASERTGFKRSSTNEASSSCWFCWTYFCCYTSTNNGRQKTMPILLKYVCFLIIAMETVDNLLG